MGILLYVCLNAVHITLSEAQFQGNDHFRDGVVGLLACKVELQGEHDVKRESDRRGRLSHEDRVNRGHEFARERIAATLE
jgi:hypothetical protein